MININVGPKFTVLSASKIILKFDQYLKIFIHRSGINNETKIKKKHEKGTSVNSKSVIT